MNKKLFTILIVAVFLLTSVSIISAAETSDDESDSSQEISVRIEWNDTGHTNERPNSVIVSLLKDGKVIETKKLNASNSWSTTFTVDGDRSFSVNESKITGYSVSTKGDASNGFVITNTIKTIKLGVAADDDSNEENNTTSAEENETQNETTNATIKKVNITEDNGTEDNVTEKDNTTTIVIEKQNTTKIVKKQPKKSDNPEPKINLRNAGIPILILIVVAFIAVFVSYTRKK